MLIALKILTKEQQWYKWITGLLQALLLYVSVTALWIVHLFSSIISLEEFWLCLISLIICISEHECYIILNLPFIISTWAKLTIIYPNHVLVTTLNYVEAFLQIILVLRSSKKTQNRIMALTIRRQTFREQNCTTVNWLFLY